GEMTSVWPAPEPILVISPSHAGQGPAPPRMDPPHRESNGDRKRSLACGLAPWIALTTEPSRSLGATVGYGRLPRRGGRLDSAGGWGVDGRHSHRAARVPRGGGAAGPGGPGTRRARAGGGPADPDAA